MALAAFAARFGDIAGRNATLALFVAAPHAARRLARAEAFTEWLRVIGGIAEFAPESVSLLLDRSGRLLDSLDLRSFETWALGGIRAAENDPERRLKFFALLDTRALHAREHGADSVALTDVERELKMFVAALWPTTPPIRVLPPADFNKPRRRCFANGGVPGPPTATAADRQNG